MLTQLVVAGSFFTDRQFNYQLTADDVCKLCDMFSKAATKHLYQFSTVAQSVLQGNPSCTRQLVVAGLLGGGSSAPVNNGAALFKQLNLDLSRVSGNGGMGDAGPA